MSINPAAVSAREQSRDVSGEFGTQPHPESGIVEAGPVTVTDQAIEALRTQMGDVDDFRGTYGDDCRGEMSQLAYQIRELELKDPQVSFPLHMVELIDGDDSPGDTKVGFTIGDLEVTRDFDFKDLYSEETFGEDCARQMAASMFAQRDRAVQEFLAATRSPAVKAALNPPVVQPDLSIVKGSKCDHCDRPATFTQIWHIDGTALKPKRLYACGLHSRGKHSCYIRIV